MCRFCSGIAGVILAFTVAGCGESAPEGPLPSKAVDPAAIDKQLEIMSQNQKKPVFTKKPVDTKPADKAPADKAPAATKPEDKKK